MSQAFDDAAADALTTVRLIPRWSLAPAAWDRVALALEDLQLALASADSRHVMRATETLDSLGPVTRLSAIPRGAQSQGHQPPPPGVLELVNTLVHPTGGWAQAGAAAPSDQTR